MAQYVYVAVETHVVIHVVLLSTHLYVARVLRDVVRPGIAAHSNCWEEQHCSEEQRQARHCGKRVYHGAPVTSTCIYVKADLAFCNDDVINGPCARSACARRTAHARSLYHTRGLWMTMGALAKKLQSIVWR